jgi:2-keto-4-pentenoate hydratase/2-oxohepta-3-ene-1,7-dioic acid hydratase in catechol pathway
VKLASYFDGEPKVGVVDPPEIWDLRAVYGRYLFETEGGAASHELAAQLVPRDMALFIRLHHGRLEEIRDALELVKGLRRADDGIAGLARPLDRTRLLPPVPSPSKIVCSGSSYVRYARYLQETGKGMRPEDVKISFLKQPGALIGHGATILFPPDSSQWDYEVELSIVIGRTCSDVSEDDAAAYIFGYSIINDACVRDIPQWTGRLDSPRGKAVDTFAPFGPWIVPAPFLGRDPNDLAIRALVDGELRQEDRTSGLLWPINRIVAYMSRYIRLLPGDVIATGSTMGNAYDTGKYLRLGQVVRCEIEGIGALENTVGVRTWQSRLGPLAPKA